MRSIYYLMLLVITLFPTKVLAGCSFLSGSTMSVGSITLPSTLAVSRDAPVGTELWSSGWVQASGNKITCNTTGSSGGTATGLGAAVAGLANNRGRQYVYATNVPGIGISVYLNEGNIGPTDPRQAYVIQERSTFTSYPVGTWDLSRGNYWWVRLVKTGPIAGGVQLNVTGSATASEQGLNFATLNFSGAATVTGRSCEVGIGSKNILVPLPSVAHADFADGVTVLADTSKARAFSIDLLCDAGVAVSYRIDGTQASGATNVLANATGPDMAIGVGVQLFRGDTGSATVQPLGTKLHHATATADGQPLGIPLAARYYQTTPRASDVRPGKVSAAATFTLSYE
jgi:type 1 fimbria pilin